MPILHALQVEFGYIDQAAEPLIAEALNITRAEVHGVITFYHDFRRSPSGRHVLKLCRAEPCQAAGGDALAARAEARLGVALGETTADGRVTIEPVYCLGLCSVSPSAMIDGPAAWWPPRRQEARRPPCGGRSMSALRIYVPGDAAAVAGADEVAAAIVSSTAKRKVAVEVVPTVRAVCIGLNLCSKSHPRGPHCLRPG